MAHSIELVLALDVFESAAELPEPDQKLLLAAEKASEKAYAPYSGFLVGAALLLADGTVHTGNNQENAAYPSGLCAERTALFGLRINDPATIITMMAVTARPAQTPTYQAAWPCGGCRQVMLEYETQQGTPIAILMQADHGQVYKCHSVSALLPLHFSRTSLV